jgi:hypothetical protein
LTVAEILKSINQLSPEERESVKQALAPQVIFVIYDESGINRYHPCAKILYARRKFEYIDIIATVEHNPESISHPAILIATKRWALVSSFQHPLAYDKNRGDIANLEAAKGQFRDIARGHLARLSKALTSHKRTNLESFAVLIRPILQADPYLRLIHEVLKRHKREITSIRKDGGKPELLRRFVIQRFCEYGFGDEKLQHSIPSDTVTFAFKHPLDFMMTAGRAFLDNPRTFSIFRNSYISWCTGYDPETFKPYLSKIKNLPSDRNDLQWLMPGSLGINQYHISDLGDPLKLPLVPCTRKNCSHHSA